jgi:hypothetical protein
LATDTITIDPTTAISISRASSATPPCRAERTPCAAHLAVRSIVVILLFVARIGLAAFLARLLARRRGRSAGLALRHRRRLSAFALVGFLDAPGLQIYALADLDRNRASLLRIVDHHAGRSGEMAHAQAVARLPFDRFAVHPGERFAVTALHDPGERHLS